MRVLGIDYGGRRVGVAVSDATGLLARPFKTLDRTRLQGEAALVKAVLEAVEEVTADEEPLAAIVVGLPKRLDGSPNDQTPKVEAFVARLAGRTSVPVVLQDERLTSVEAESRLAVREKDWRRRKQMLDAAAAAVMLQDYLDAHRPAPVADSDRF